MLVGLSPSLDSPTAMRKQMNNIVKKKIKDTIELYKVLHKIEYEQVVKMVEQKKKHIKNQGKIDSKIIKRVLMEYPEILLDMIEKATNPDEYKWFVSKDGMKYFSKVCPEFLLIKKI